MNESLYYISGNIYDYNNCLYINNQTQFFVWGEHHTYDNEYLDSNNSYAIWVSRYHSDGFGFDILSCDKLTNREKLIEVKTGKSNDFSLTKHEYEVMINANKYNAHYYIYKYTYNKNNNLIYPKIYKYEKDNMLISDNTIYTLYPCITEKAYNYNKTYYKIKKN